ncbi:PREDICTED: myosin-11-like [Amphimedon queenslandica]|uniref:Uncharacterized protein n=1 Tax=Amphimedon queenslandica TaxID=400682 RepID=A0AAN0J0E1_AMPQE|nr:PREDICTED: myosin-11-like [Amphimedon queenslandica]|eukprot:XP_019850183.1 PREDICTED: myosin-11-like [Amphimedon queenslandica]
MSVLAAGAIAGGAGKAALLEKSNMLDEVNSLLDLMVSEKQALEEKIVSLEEQVKGSKTSEDKTNEKEANALRKGEIKELAVLRTELAMERELISSLRDRVERTSEDCQRERHEHKKWIDELQEQLSYIQLQYQKEKRENKRLQEVLLKRNEKNDALIAENNKLIRTLEKLEEKQSKTRTTLLALKRKVTLESKTIKGEEEKRDTEINGIVEERVKKRLKILLEEKEAELKDMRNQVIQRDGIIKKQENQLNRLRDELSNQLSGFEKELQSSRLELPELRKALKMQQKKLRKSEEALQMERQESQQLLASTEAHITKLLGVLDKERHDHHKEVHSLCVAMATQKQELQMELDRLKDVSMRRVTELAKEVWLLKNKNNNN